MKECMLCTKKLGDINDFRTLDNGSLCCECYTKVAGEYRKGTFTTSEAIALKEKSQSLRTRRQSVFRVLTKIAYKEKYSYTKLSKMISTELGKISELVFQKDIDNLDSEQLTIALEKLYDMRSEVFAHYTLKELNEISTDLTKDYYKFLNKFYRDVELESVDELVETSLTKIRY